MQEGEDGVSVYRIRNRSSINTKERNRRNEQSMLLASLRANVPDFRVRLALLSFLNKKKKNFSFYFIFFFKKRHFVHNFFLILF